MSSSKSPPETAVPDSSADSHGLILAEQLQLVKTERELQQMIERINGQLNQLLVEELQLKAGGQPLESPPHQSFPEVRPKQSSSPTPTTSTHHNELLIELDSAVDVNRQSLDFGLRWEPGKMVDDEEEEEDEEEDD